MFLEELKCERDVMYSLKEDCGLIAKFANSTSKLEELPTGYQSRLTS